MGGIFSFGRERRHSNKVANCKGIADASVEGGIVEVRIPDATQRHKSKSKSFHSVFTKSFKKTNRSPSSSSAPSVGDEKVEIDRLSQEIEKLKADFNDEIEELKAEKEILIEENTRLRKENKTLNAVTLNLVPTLRAAKDKACDAEKDALARALSLEQEKDKTQRRFKMYREAKEKEIQDILKKKQILMHKLRKFDNTDGSVHDLLLDNNDVLQQCPTISEWVLDNQSITNVHLHDKVSGGALVEKPSFIDLKTERELYSDVQSVMTSLHHIEYGVPRSNIYLIYITFTDDMLEAVNLFMDGCRRLMLQYEMDERLLVFFHFPWFLEDVDEDYKCACEEIFQDSNIFVTFIGEDNDGQICQGIMSEVVNLPKQCIFGSLEKPLLDDIQFDKKKHHLIYGLYCIDAFVSACLSTLEDICKNFLEKQYQQRELEKARQKDNSYGEIQRDFSNWNILDIDRQHCIQGNIYKNISNTINIEKELESLNNYLHKDGPVQPLLLTGRPGSGKSFLLAHWVQNLRKSLQNVCILYHVASVGSPDSRSISHLLRRFISIIADRIPIAVNPDQLEKDFPRYLEQACNNYSNGIVIVIDGADILDNIDNLKWLLDPLLFSVRVVISVSSENYPEKWKSWPDLQLTGEYKDAHTNEYKDVHLLQAKCSHIFDERFLGDLFRKVFTGIILKPAVKENLCNHLFCNLCVLLVSSKSVSEVEETLKQCISQIKLSHLYSFIISSLISYYDENLVFQILYFLLVSRNGIHIMEFADLIPDVDLLHVYVVLSFLIKYEVVERVYGFYQIARKQVQKAVRKCFNRLILCEEQDHTYRNMFIQMLVERFEGGFVSYRVADELPWQLVEVGRKEKLEVCMSSHVIFLRLYQMGKYSCIKDYWAYLGRDVPGIYHAYIDTYKGVEDGIEDRAKEQITVMYDVLGEFTLDQGHYRLAHESFEKSLELKETHFDPDDPRIGYSLISLGRLFWQWKKFQTAEDYYNQVLEVKDENGQANTISYAKCLEWLAILYKYPCAEERTDAVESCRKQASQIRQLYYIEYTLEKMIRVFRELSNTVDTLLEEGANFDELVNHLKDIGVLFFNINRYDESIEVFNRTLEKCVKIYGTQHPFVAEVMCKLSDLYELFDEYVKAEEHVEKALLIFLENNTEISLGRAWKKFIKLLKKQKKFDKIENWKRKFFTNRNEDAEDESSGYVGNSSNVSAVHLNNK